MPDLGALQQMALSVSSEADMDALFDALFDRVNSCWQHADQQRCVFAPISRATLDELDAYLAWMARPSVASSLRVDVWDSSLRLTWMIQSKHRGDPNELPAWRRARDAARAELDRRGVDTAALLHGLLSDD